MTLFTTSGFTSLQEFSELDETDLDELKVVQSEERAKLLTAAQLLHDYENEGLKSANTLRCVTCKHEFVSTCRYSPNSMRVALRTTRQWRV